MLSLLLTATLLGAAPVPSEPPEPSSSAPPAPVRSRAPVVAGIGAGLLLTGSVIWLVTNVHEGVVLSGPGNPAEIQVTQWRIQQTRLGGIALGLVGACTVGIAAAMWSWEPSPARPVSAAPLLLPGGGGVAFSGTWP